MIKSIKKSQTHFKNSAAKRLEKNQKTLEDLIGSYCIYKERLFIRHVKVIEAKINDWGVNFSLEVVHAPGFDDDGPKNFNIYGAWEIVGITDKEVYAFYVSWLLIFRDDIVERIKSSAIEANNSHQLLRIINKVLDGDDGP